MASITLPGPLGVLKSQLPFPAVVLCRGDVPVETSSDTASDAPKDVFLNAWASEIT